VPLVNPPSQFDVLLRRGQVVDGSGAQPHRADVGVRGDRIVAIEAELHGTAADVVECEGRYLLPGLIDAHSHADGAVFDDGTQLAQLRQGITTVIIGQDGVSYAPGDGQYASEYFSAINGAHPSYRGGSVSDLLATYDGTTALNVAYLVPHGTIRHAVMGFAQRPPTAGELARMSELVTQGLADGAVGLSSGLDYVPGLFADAAELSSLCVPVAEARGVYVTHMRGGYETNARIGVDEVREICDRSAVAAHISHFHGPAALLTALVDEASAAGIDLSFDSYPYRRGFTLLSMPMLPPDLLSLGSRAAAAQLADAGVRQDLSRDWLPQVAARPDMGGDWAARATIAHVAADEFGWVHGLTLAEAAARIGQEPGDFGLRLLSDSRLEVSAVFALPPGRSNQDLRTLLRHPGQLAGSDAIFIGAHPHPRGWGAFARLLGRHTRQLGDYSWGEVAVHAAARAADRFGLRNRGVLREGAYADIAVVDPRLVIDDASYDEPRRLARGIADVLVNGTLVLRGGVLTGARSGRAIRHRHA
jgi:N-acyl-D-amino-acid deacylase